MYEAEVNGLVESIETLPLEVRRQFAEFRDRIASRTVLPWGEHCTECNWPTCYTTCELYAPRTDGACRQFVDGMVRIDQKDGANPYLLKMRFKRWAKLWTVGNLKLYSPPSAERKEHLNIAVGAAARVLPLPGGLKRRVLGKINYVRRRSAEEADTDGEMPDCFMIECYNPNQRTITLTLTIRLRLLSDGRPFQKMISLPPGFTRATAALLEIGSAVDLSRAFEVEIVPNQCDDTVLYFGLVDFVKNRGVVEPAPAEATAVKKWKCIVWDLDNTLWDGTLIEDGLEKIRVRQGVIDVIRETDRRGILHSIASKNNPEEAMKVLRLCGLDDYFLYPQINWGPKSQSIAQLVQSLNIGMDTVAFVDDQQFEREEVKAVLPQVIVLDASTYASIPDRPECRVPVTEESRRRRQLYRQQQQREIVRESYNGDYLRFLKECQIEMNLLSLDEVNVERVYELAQRTNQLNFSGNRYPREQLKKIMASDGLESHVIQCSDKFGSYGIAGFAVIDPHEPRLLDLMFSCRVQGKRVEHAFFSFVLKRFAGARKMDFFANYRKTSKNATAGKVFEEFGFECLGEKEGVTSLVYRRDRPILDDEIITIKAGDRAA